MMITMELNPIQGTIVFFPVHSRSQWLRLNHLWLLMSMRFFMDGLWLLLHDSQEVIVIEFPKVLSMGV
jgi:hypothetical protein